MVEKWTPELDAMPLLDAAEKKLYQRLIGIGFWLICVGRFDIHFTINQLRHFAQELRKGHLEDVIRFSLFFQQWKNQGVTNAGKTTVSVWEELDSRKFSFPDQWNFIIRTSFLKIY